MNRFFSLSLMFPVFLIVILMISFTQYQGLAMYELSEIMLRDCADSANDAAMEFALSEAVVDAVGNISLDIEEVWYTYKANFLMAMNLYSERNMELFEAYCPATIIAVNDGYYMRMRTLVTNSSGVQEVAYVFSQKIPFARKNGSLLISDTMDGTNIYYYDTGVGSSEQVYVYDASVSDIAGLHDTGAIATELMRAMDYCIALENESMSTGLWDANTFYVPSELTDELLYNTVTFEGFTMLNLIQGFDMKGTKPIDYYTITNTQIVDAIDYLCFSLNGEFYYLSSAYELPSGSSILTSTSTREQAALKGYSPWLG